MSATAAGRLADVRRWTRATRPPIPWGRRLDQVYSWGIAAAILGVLVYGLAVDALTAVVSPARLQEAGPALALIAALVATRWGTVLGPVVFTRPDVAHVLSAPLPRRGLAWRRLAVALLGGAAVGAVVAVPLVVGVTGGTRALAPARSAGLIAGLALTGVLAVALAHAVAVSGRVQRVLAAGLPLAVLAAIVIGATGLAGATDVGTGATAGGAGAAGVLATGGAGWLDWSGPWGWWLLPVTGARTWPLGLAALGLLTLLAAALAVRAAGAGSAERHEVRARTRARLGAAIGTFDARGAGLLVRSGGARRPTRLRCPRDPRLTLLWRHAIAWRRRPGTLASGVVLGAGAGVLGSLTGSDPVAGLAAGAVAYVAVATLLEPLRVELDRPQRPPILLARPVGSLIAGHVVPPAAVATVAALVGGLVALAVAGGSPVGVLYAACAVPVAAACAAQSARRGGRIPDSVLFLGAGGTDPSGGGGLIVAWVLAWPAAAVALAGGPVALATLGGQGALWGAVVLGATGFTLWSLLRDATEGSAGSA